MVRTDPCFPEALGQGERRAVCACPIKRYLGDSANEGQAGARDEADDIGAHRSIPRVISGRKDKLRQHNCVADNAGIEIRELIVTAILSVFEVGNR